MVKGMHVNYAILCQVKLGWVKGSPKLTLASFEPGVFLVDNKEFTTATDDLAVFAADFRAFE